MRQLVRFALYSLTLASLTLACAGASPCPDGPEPGVDFTGEWDTQWGLVRLEQRAHAATGTYTYLSDDRPITGRLEGVVSGRHLRFRWSERDEGGFGWFAMTADGQSFVGEWWPDGGGETHVWNGVRRGP